jgi:hypothetical protein
MLSVFLVHVKIKKVVNNILPLKVVKTYRFTTTKRAFSGFQIPWKEKASREKKRRTLH